MKYLVGYSGFVGSNLYNSTEFDGVFNSKNISEAFGKKPDLLIYAGIPSQKFLANANPEKDMEIINGAIKNIKKINPKEIVLISTIDVYHNPVDVDEDSNVDINLLNPYGHNRYQLENWIRENFEKYLIVRLPGLYGKNIKKNFIYDLINIIPSMLTCDKFTEIVHKDNLIKKYYTKQANDFYKLKDIDDKDRKKLKLYFKKIGFSALNFTDSRGRFQFYNLKYLWNHIEIARRNNIKILNIATEPVYIYELYQFINGKEFTNEINSKIPNYNYHTKYYKLFNGKDGYIYDKEFIKQDIKRFVQKNSVVKLAISNIAWKRKYDDEILKYISNRGYTGLEIAPTTFVSQDPYNHVKDIKNITEKIKVQYNLDIISMQSIWYGQKGNIFNPDEAQDLIQYTKKAIDCANNIKCNNIVFGCPKNRIIPKDKTMDDIIYFFKEIGNYAKEKNTIVSIEANPTIYHTNFINSTKEAFDFVKKVDSEGVKVNVDFGTIIENKESLEEIFNNIELVHHIHISEPNLEPIIRRKRHIQLASFLKKNHYNKYISIEMKNIDNIKKLKKIIDYVYEVFS